MKVNYNNDWLGLIGGIVGVGVCALGFMGISYAGYRWELWRAPCSRVYNGDELIYSGNSYYYQTESRGASTMFQEHSHRFWFPRMEKEIMSNDIRIETVSCKEI